MLPPDLLRTLLSSDGLCIQSELDVARATLLWAAADPQQRGPLLPDLLPAARMPPGLLAQEAARSGLLGAGSGWLSQTGAAAQQPQQHEAPPPQPPTPQQGRSPADVGAELELGHAFVAACQQLQRDQSLSVAAGNAAASCSGGVEAALVAYRPRLSSPTGLMMAGGLDDGWRALRCAVWCALHVFAPALNTHAVDNALRWAGCADRAAATGGRSRHR